MGGIFVARGAGDSGPGVVQLIDNLFELVIRLGQTCGIKRVGLDDVGTSRQILLVNPLDDVRAGEQQQIVIALQIVRVIGETLAPEIGFS